MVTYRMRATDIAIIIQALFQILAEVETIFENIALHTAHKFVSKQIESVLFIYAYI